MKNRITRESSLRAVLLATAVFGSFFVHIAIAAVTPAISPQVQSRSEQTEARLEFEVATVRALPSGAPNPAARFGCRGVDRMVSPENAPIPAAVPQGRCVGEIALQQLVALAYGVQRRYVSGPPESMRSGSFQLFQINAAAPDPAMTTSDHLKQMLQSLLADRFQVAFHREKKQSREYLLRVGRDGPKLRAASGAEEVPHIVPSGIGPGSITVRGRSEMGKFATFLASFVGYPIVDKTAISGMHEYLLRLNMVPGQRGAATGVRGAGGGAGTISITEFDPPVSIALQEQLGLRLDAEEITVEMIIIDRAQMPTEN